MSKFPQFLVDVEWNGTTATLSCAGVVDMLTAPDLERRIDDVLAQGPSAVIIDLTLVDFISSRGLCVLLETHKRCSPAMGFVVVANGPATLRPMKIMGLTDILCVRTRMDDALTELRVQR